MRRHAAPIARWIAALEGGALRPQLAACYGADQASRWESQYLEALAAFAARCGGQGEVVIARCPAQMNLMGMHIDYGGMPSLRMAVRGADTLALARPAPDGQVRLHSLMRAPGEAADRFAPASFSLREVVPAEPVATRQALMDYAGRVDRRRLAAGWAILPQGGLIFLESYFRQRHALQGMDCLVWSNVSPSGGMSSSSALVIATAYAALGANGLAPGVDMPEEELVDGIGTSEWIRGTRGGTADHGGMILGKTGKLVRVGVFPARSLGYAALPEAYAALILDSGVPRVYDEAVKEETVIAYPLGAFLIRQLILPRLAGTPGFEGLVPDYAERIHYIRDFTCENLGIGLPQLYQLLRALPQTTTLAEVEKQAGAAYAPFHQQQIGGRFQRITADYPIRLRRRFAFGLAEQDRVRAMLGYLNEGRLATALQLVRLAHDGDLDREVSDADLEARRRVALAGEEAGQLCFLPGGYGRMTPAYDRVVRVVNQYLAERGGAEAGAVQRLGAGWGGNVGGLVRRELLSGEEGRGFERLLRQELGIEAELEQCQALPGEGACLLKAAW
jgi:galactokinase